MNIATKISDSVHLSDNGLDIITSDGKKTYFNYYWLRDNCPSSFDSTTRERKFDIFHLDNAPVAQSANIADDKLVIDWANEAHISTYLLQDIMPFADATRRKDVSDLPRKAWYKDFYPQISRFSHAELMNDKENVANWIKSIITDGVTIVTDMPDTDSGLTQTANLIGHIRPTFFGDYFNVRTHINPTNLAYTAGPLELHTDTPAEEAAPGVQFLHCRTNSVDGGRSLFADGVAVANDFRELDPEGFKLLSEIDIPFYCEHDHYDMRSRQHVIELDEKGNVSGLTISQHMLDMLDLPQSLLDQYYPAFCRFGKLLQQDKYVMKFLLKAGECIVFDNHRIVHGREGYTASSGDRYLRGTYTDREEMRSTYRAIVGEGRFK